MLGKVNMAKDMRNRLTIMIGQTISKIGSGFCADFRESNLQAYMDQ